MNRRCDRYMNPKAQKSNTFCTHTFCIPNVGDCRDENTVDFKLQRGIDRGINQSINQSNQIHISSKAFDSNEPRLEKPHHKTLARYSKLAQYVPLQMQQATTTTAATYQCQRHTKEKNVPSLEPMYQLLYKNLFLLPKNVLPNAGSALPHVPLS